MLVKVIITITILLCGRVENIRLCGRQLADLLNNICERNGGFHTPSHATTNGSNVTFRKRAVIEFLQPRFRKTGTEDANSNTEAEFNNDGVEEFSFNNGVVDECCKKPCTFSTLVSYCANVQNSGNIELQEFLPSGVEDERNEAGSNLPESEIQQISSDVSSTSDSESDSENHRQNLGHSDRNRPVFIVLSQTSDDEDRSTGEYWI